MPRTRTTKKLAQRIDLNYFKRPGPLRRWRFWLSVAAPALALAALGWHAVRGDARAYSAGALAPAHALLASRCEACHVRQAAGLTGLDGPVGLGQRPSAKASFATSFSASSSDAACLSCHDGPPHHADAAFTPTCAACHVEHRGAVLLAATADSACTQCHGDLRTGAGTPTAFARHIGSFTSKHPEFAVLRTGRGNSTSLKLNHFRHMQPNLMGPRGPVQLACGDCHRAAADSRPWPYAASATASSAAGKASATSAVSAAANGGAFLAAASGGAFIVAASRAYMAPPTYANACAGCHTLEFDARFSQGVPHDKPEVVHAFLLQTFRAYIAAHPAELREPAQPGRELPEQPLGGTYRTLTPREWVAERTAEAEELLWRKTCVQCHALVQTSGSALPAIAPSNVTARFMPHARFDHSKHELLKCESCHAGALTSQARSDLLLPGIATCRQCHASDPGGIGGNAQAAEARCFECHTYHDYTQWNPRPGQLTLPELRPTALRLP